MSEGRCGVLAQFPEQGIYRIKPLCPDYIVCRFAAGVTRIHALIMSPNDKFIIWPDVIFAADNVSNAGCKFQKPRFYRERQHYA